MACFLVIGIAIRRAWFDMDNHFGQAGNFMKETMTDFLGNGMAGRCRQIWSNGNMHLGMKPVAHPAHTNTRQVTNTSRRRNDLFGCR